MKHIIEGLQLEIDYHTDMIAYYTLQAVRDTRHSEYYDQSIQAHNLIREDKEDLLSNLLSKVNRD